MSRLVVGSGGLTGRGELQFDCIGGSIQCDNIPDESEMANFVAHALLEGFRSHCCFSSFRNASRRVSIPSTA